MFDNVLDDIYPDDEEFIANLRQSSRHRIPPYRAAIIRVMLKMLRPDWEDAIYELNLVSRGEVEEDTDCKRNRDYFGEEEDSGQVCQLQLKLCTKMMELRSASNSRQEEPSTLKRLARRSILRHSIRNRAGKISLLQNDGNGTNKFDIREVLPGELIDYLKDGVREE
ncbi:unnamed protein product [Toxocara canis]|uniref:Uncharacterized protein n=1 Tax=Toxocara canis TaxID=6265 RepID=A0A3P7ESQ0_TOXCA|nr:unnamed protein product [Toxocara canis]